MSESQSDVGVVKLSLDRADEVCGELGAVGRFQRLVIEPLRRGGVVPASSLCETGQLFLQLLAPLHLLVPLTVKRVD